MTADQSDWSFRWLTDWEEIWAPPFLSEWRHCLDRAPQAHVFFEPEMVRAWLDAYEPLYDVRPRFLLAKRGAETTVLLPMVQLRAGWKDLWSRSIVPIGYAGFDYHDPVASGEDSESMWSGFWAEFERELVVRWGGSFDSTAIYGLRSQCRPADLHWSAQHEAETRTKGPINGDVSPTIDLRRFASIDEFLSSRSANLRGDVGRRLRRLKELGELSHHVYRSDENDAALASIREMLRQNAIRWPMTWRLRSFYDRLVVNCLPSGLLHLSELRIDGVAVSWHLGFIHRKRFYYYLPAFSSRLAAYSPGKVHIRMLIADAIERGVETFDFLRGDEPYKYLWSNAETNSFGLLWPSRTPGATARLAWSGRAKPRLVRVRRRAKNLAARMVKRLQPT